MKPDPQLDHAGQVVTTEETVAASNGALVSGTQRPTPTPTRCWRWSQWQLETPAVVVHRLGGEAPLVPPPPALGERMEAQHRLGLGRRLDAARRLPLAVGDLVQLQAQLALGLVPLDGPERDESPLAVGGVIGRAVESWITGGAPPTSPLCRRC